ncbi:MAG: T9SS type A sorting domain-containing protein, partial [Paludibacteraceae bacterium]|nr:T9SS type A sorting domain-containing protein [Paludibacteraceae bacterium]
SHTEEAFYQTQTALKSLKSFEMDSYMADAQGEFEMSAYPNPFKTVVNAKLNAPKAATVTLEILDATGRLIQNYGEYNLEAGDNVVTLNTASVGIGQFTLRTIYGGEVFTQTIIKK